MIGAKRLFPTLAAVFITYLGFGVLLIVYYLGALEPSHGLLAPHRSLSLRNLFLGTLLSLYPLGGILGNYCLQILSDLFGRKKMLLLSIGVSAVSYLLIGMALKMAAFHLLFFSTFLAGFFQVSLGVIKKMVKDLAHFEENSSDLGAIYANMGIGLFFGPIVGAELIGQEGLPFTLDTPVWFLSVVFMILFFFVFSMQKETSLFEGKEEVSWKKEISTFFTEIWKKPACHFQGINFISYFAMFLFFRSYPMIVVDYFGYDISLLDELLSFLSIPLLIANLLVFRPLSKRVPTQRMLRFFSLLLFIGFTAMLLPRSTLMLWVLLALVNFTIAILTALASALLKKERGSYVEGLPYNLTFFLVADFAATLLAPLLILIHPSIPLFLAACIPLVLCLRGYTKTN